MANSPTSGTLARSVDRLLAASPLSLRRFRSPKLAPLDSIALIGLLCLAGYAVTALAAPAPNVHASVAGLWLPPADVAIALACAALGRSGALGPRDRLAWRGIAAAGLLLAAADGLAVLAPQSSGPAAGLGGAVSAVLVLAMAPAGLLLLGAQRARAGRPLVQGVADLALVGLAIWLASWYFLLRPAVGEAAEGLANPFLVASVSTIAFMALAARTYLRPPASLSRSGTALFLTAAAAAIAGTIATTQPWSNVAEVRAFGGLALGGARLAVLGGALSERGVRGRGVSRPVEDAPSQLFYVCIALGYAPLVGRAIELGLDYVLVAAGWLALTALIVARQALAIHQASDLRRLRRESEARLGWLVRNSSDLIMAVRPDATLEYVSPSVERLLRVAPGTLLGRRLGELAHPEDAAALAALVGQAAAVPGRRVSGEWRLRLSDDSFLPVETVAAAGTEDAASSVVLNTRDLQERKALEQKLTFQAFHDPLTRLANRSLFRERVEHILERRASGDVAVLFLDLDNFKTINDSLGHAAGDHVLVEMGHRLRSCIRTEDTAARLGGDEFGVLLEDADATAAARVAERIRLSLGVPFLLLGHEVFVSASIGIALRQAGDVTGDLLRNADVAMYTAKAKGKARFELFEPAMHDAVVARLTMEAELRRALEREEFVVHYQPIVRLESGDVIGAEALVRWQHPTRGLVAPLEFIPLAEETGLIVPLGGWVLRQACSQLATWQRLRAGVEPFIMSVNLSSRELVREAIVDEVAAAVDACGIRPGWLLLEVTETVLMADPQTASSTLERLRDLGVRIALDDFGSGYSSLSHLRRFPIDVVKIDKSFVDDVTLPGAESAIARGIIELGRAMRIQTVAEGIEADEQAETLRRLGCELGQGFYFSRPLDAQSWAGLLAEDGGSSPGPATGPAAAAAGTRLGTEAA